jgi:hypothetical protein
MQDVVERLLRCLYYACVLSHIFGNQGPEPPRPLSSNRRTGEGRTGGTGANDGVLGQALRDSVRVVPIAARAAIPAASRIAIATFHTLPVLPPAFPPRVPVAPISSPATAV